MFYIYADGNSIYDPTVSAYYLFDPTLTLEFGKAGSLEFSIPKDNIYYDSLIQMKTIVTVKLDDTEIFRGRVLSFETGFDNFKKVYCEGDLAYLVDSVYKSVNFRGGSHDLFASIIANHNSMVEPYKRFTVGTVNIDNREIIIKGKSNDETEEEYDYQQIAINSTTDEWNNTYDFIQSTIIDNCGGYLRTRRVGNTTYIDLLKEYGRTSSQQVAFGVNLLDISQEVTADELFTVLIPLGNDNLTISSVNNGSIELVQPLAVNYYGRIVRTHVFQNVTEASTLLENAKRYLELNSIPPISYTARAIDLHLLNDNTDSINVGDRVWIDSPPHGISRYITCTKIEYDFANPENNTYTFGDPRQTLTQRYREDKRKPTTTDTNSAGYSSGISQALDKQNEEIDKKIADAKDWIYKEWLDVDPDNPDGTGSIGGAYRRINEMKQILETQVGINFDATTGNVNLQSLTQKLNQQGQQIGEAESKINSFSGEVNGELQAVSSMIARVQTDTGERIASLEVIATEHGTKIAGIADELDIEAIKTHIGGVSESLDEMKRKLKTQVGLDMDAETGLINLQSLTQTVNDQGEVLAQTRSGLETLSTNQQATSRLFAEYQTATGTRIAQVEATADALGTNLNLKADKVTVDSKFTKFNGDIEAINARFDTITANKITTAELEAVLANIQQLKVNSIMASGPVYASSMYIGPNPSPTNTVVTQGNVNATLAKIGNAGAHGNAHAHLITENSDGTITLGYATKDPQTFNIRATKTYREGVAAALVAVKITELDKDPIYTDSYSSNDREYTVHIWSKTDSGAVKRTPIKVSGSRAWQDGYTSGAAAGSQESYQDGVDSVRVQSVIARTIEGWGTDHYNKQTHTTSVFGTVKLSSGKNDYVFQLNTGTDAYNDGVADGVNSVTIASVTRTPGVPDSYNSLSNKTTINYTATASNGKTFLGSFTTDTKAYDDGYTKGSKSGTDSVTITSLGKDPSTSYSHDYTKHTVAVPIKTVISNGKSKTGSITVNTTTHYTAGVNSVKVSSVTKNGNETYNSSLHTTTIPILVKLSSGVNNYTASLTTGTTAYDTGKTAGINSVSISSVAIAVTNNDYTHNKITLTATATGSNGKTKTGTKEINVGTYYTNGKNAGADGVSIDSVDIAVTNNDYTHNKITLTSTAKTNNNKTKSATKEINVGTYYTNGKNAGAASVNIDSVDIAVTNNDYAHNKITLTATAKAGGGTKTKSTSKEIVLTTYYNNGKSAGVDSVSVKSIAYDSSVGLSHDWSNHIIKYPVIVTLNNSNKTGTATLNIDATGHYNKGTQGVMDEMTASGLVAGQTYGTSTVQFAVTIKRGTAKKTFNFNVDALQQWKWGYNDGYNAAWQNVPEPVSASGPYTGGYGNKWYTVNMSDGTSVDVAAK